MTRPLLTPTPPYVPAGTVLLLRYVKVHVEPTFVTLATGAVQSWRLRRMPESCQVWKGIGKCRDEQVGIGDGDFRPGESCRLHRCPVRLPCWLSTSPRLHCYATAQLRRRCPDRRYRRWHSPQHRCQGYLPEPSHRSDRPSHSRRHRISHRCRRAETKTFGIVIRKSSRARWCSMRQRQ